MLEVAILGGPGGGAMVAQSIERLARSGVAVQLAGFLNDQVSYGKMLGRFDDWRAVPQTASFIAPLHKAKDMQRRAARILGLGIPPGRWCSVVDATAIVGTDAQVGAGSFVGAYCVVDAGARVGRHAGLWPAAQVGHDSVLGDFVFLGRGAVVSGRCHVDTGAHVGPLAVIRDGCRIGRFAVIGAGAVVLRDVPDHAIVAGNPAQPIGALNAADDPKN